MPATEQRVEGIKDALLDRGHKAKPSQILACGYQRAAEMVKRAYQYLDDNDTKPHINLIEPELVLPNPVNGSYR